MSFLQMHAAMFTQEQREAFEFCYGVQVDEQGDIEEIKAFVDPALLADWVDGVSVRSAIPAKQAEEHIRSGLSKSKGDTLMAFFQNEAILDGEVINEIFAA